MTDRHRVVVAGLVYRPREGDTDYEFLIMRRPNDATFYKGVWCAPGGGVEIEDFTDALPLEVGLLRELDEEVGKMTLGIPFLVNARAFTRKDGVGVVVLTYSLLHYEGEPHTSPEAAELAWVTHEEAGSYNLIGDTHREMGRALHFLGR